MTDTSVPDSWTCPRWLTIYTRNELRWLAERLDTRVKEQRQIIIQLRAHIEKLEAHQ